MRGLRRAGGMSSASDAASDASCSGSLMTTVTAPSAVAARSTDRWISENEDDEVNDDDAENDEELTPIMAACRDEQFSLVKKLIRRNKASDRHLTKH